MLTQQDQLPLYKLSVRILIFNFGVVPCESCVAMYALGQVRGYGPHSELCNPKVVGMNPGCFSYLFNNRSVSMLQTPFTT